MSPEPVEGYEGIEGGGVEQPAVLTIAKSVPSADLGYSPATLPPLRGAMSESVDKKELIKRVSRRLAKETEIVEEIVDATVEEIYEALKQGSSVSLRNLGTFYVRPERSSWVFRFNPSQRLRKLFGWASTYKGQS